MRLRESGMPQVEVWERFFDAERTLRALGLAEDAGDVADLGAGYGTFSLAAARMSSGRVYAVDVDAELLAQIGVRAICQGLGNVVTLARDVHAEGTGLGGASVDAVLLFNILHGEDPETLLAEAYRILRPGGLLAVTHWVSDRPTPRGPSMEIRPRPDACVTWATSAGFRMRGPVIDLPPFHFGISFDR